MSCPSSGCAIGVKVGARITLVASLSAWTPPRALDGFYGVRALSGVTASRTELRRAFAHFRGVHDALALPDDCWNG